MKLKALALSAFLFTGFSTRCASLGMPSLQQVRAGGHTVVTIFLLGLVGRAIWAGWKKENEQDGIVLLGAVLSALLVADIATYTGMIES